MALLSPAKREPTVERSLRRLREKLKQRQLVMRLDREVSIRRLDEVAIGDSTDLRGEDGLQFLRDVFDDRIREGDRELAVGKRQLCRIGVLDRHVRPIEPLAPLRVYVDGNNLIARVETLERRATARSD